MTQAVAVEPTTDLTTPEVDIDLIVVVEGRNPRRHMDPKALKLMSENIADIGLIKPLTVDVVDDHFELVAGHRRLKAAKMAGLKTIPISVRKGGGVSQVVAAENDHVEKLDPVSQGLAWQAIKEEFGLTTNKEVADKERVSLDAVGEHFRILRLPEKVQAYFAEGIVPPEGERPLRGIAKVSPRMAECVCELAKRKKVKPSRFVEQVDDLLREIPQAQFDDPPTAISAFRNPLAEVVPDASQRDRLVARLQETWPNQTIDAGYDVYFYEQEIDEARAAGVLLEYATTTAYAPVRFICDAEFAADLAERVLDRKIKKVKKDRREREKAAKAAAAATEGVDPSADEDEQAAERKKAEAKRKRDEARRRKEVAQKVTRNEDIGRNIARRHGKRSEQRAGARLEVLVDLLLDAYPAFGSGLRLALGQLRELEGEEIAYASVGDATAYLRDRVARADSVAEKVELMAEALVADQLVDRSVLPFGQGWEGPAFDLDEAAQEGLAPDIKALTPKVAA